MPYVVVVLLVLVLEKVMYLRSENIYCYMCQLDNPLEKAEIFKWFHLNGFISFHLDHQPFPHSFEFNEIKIEDFWLRLRSRENRNNGHFLVCVE